MASFAPRFVKAVECILIAVGILATFSLAALAQTNVVTVTNYVTVVLTNIVTVTNVVDSLPPLKPMLAAAPVPPTPVNNPWNSSVSAGLTLTRGNSRTLMATADFLTGKKTPEDEYSIGLGAAYGNQDSRETVNNYKAFDQWNHLFTGRFYSYLRADFLRDLIADLDYRLSVGPGLGYYLVKATNTSLAVESGVGLEYQRLGRKDETFATARLAERFEHTFNASARVWQNVELLPQVDMLENYVVNSEIGLEAPISKTFSLKTYFDDSYANRPAAGRQKNDSKIVAAVAYKF